MDNQLEYEKGTDPSLTVVALSNDGSEPVLLQGPDPNDLLNPQNWSPWRKRLIFTALMSSSLLADGYATQRQTGGEHTTNLITGA